MKFNRELYKEAYKLGYKKARLDEAVIGNGGLTPLENQVLGNLLGVLAQKFAGGWRSRTPEEHIEAIGHGLSELIYEEAAEAIETANMYATDEVGEFDYGEIDQEKIIKELFNLISGKISYDMI